MEKLKIRIVLNFVAYFINIPIINENGSQIMKYHTKNRTKILNCLKVNSDKHMTIEQIDEALNHEVPLASIYRNMDDLVAEGIVRKYVIDRNNSACYQIIDDGNEHNHFHLLCTKCGKLIHLECHEVDHLLKHISDEHSFSIDISKVTLYGLCEDCQREENK